MDSKINKVRHLKNAPIQEALIDIKYSLDDRLSIEKLEKFAEKIDGYPEKKKSLEFKIGFNLEKKEKVSEEKLLRNGTILSNEELGQVLQLRINGFTFNKIKNYKGWDSFIAEPQRIWELFTNEFDFLKITRIGLRFINRFPIEEVEKLDSYFNVLPKVPSKFGNSIEDLNLSLVLPNKNKESIKAILKESLQSDQKNNRFFILDIDVFDSNLNEKIKSKDLWNCFLNLRNYKNQIFFGSTTNKLTSKYE